MFKYFAIKKYCNKLQPTLESRYGIKNFYTASQVRATVYQCNFNEKYLPLGYLLFLTKEEMSAILAVEFPHVCINSYKKEILALIDNRSIANKLTSLLS